MDWSPVTTQKSAKGKHLTGADKQPSNAKDPPPLDPTSQETEPPPTDNTPLEQLVYQINNFIQTEKHLQTYNNEL